MWGIWLVAIIERKKIDDPDKPWFDLFRICFELVSAFGGIGLSLGTPLVRYGAQLAYMDRWLSAHRYHLQSDWLFGG